MKKEYIKPTSTVYQVGLRKGTCQGLYTTSEYKEDSRQTIEYNSYSNESLFNSTGTSTNIWEEW